MLTYSKDLFLIFFIVIYELIFMLQDIFQNDRFHFRKKCYYKPNYYNNLIKNENEPGFKILKTYNLSNSDNLIVYSLYGNNPKYFKYIFSNINYIQKNLKIGILDFIVVLNYLKV